MVRKWKKTIWKFWVKEMFTSKSPEMVVKYGSIKFWKFAKNYQELFLILKLKLVRLLTGSETSGSDSRKISTKGKKKQMFIHRDWFRVRAHGLEVTPPNQLSPISATSKLELGDSQGICFHEPVVDRRLIVVFFNLYTNLFSVYSFCLFCNVNAFLVSWICFTWLFNFFG